MGIYGGKPSLDIDFASGIRKAKLPLAVLAAVLALLIVSPLVLDLFKPKPLNIRFKDNPIEIGKSTIIVIEIQNTLNKDVKDVSLSLKAIDEEALIISPTSFNVGVLGAGENRIVDKVLVRANPAKEVLPGNYEIEVRLSIGGKEFVQREALQVVSG